MTWLNRRPLACAFAAGALIALAGCTSVPDKANFDPALFQRQPAEATFEERVAVLADPAAMEMTVTGERVSGGSEAAGLYAPVQMPIGRIVHEAALAAFADAFPGGAPAVERAGAEPGAPTVALRVAQYDYRDRLQYVVPLLIPFGGLLVFEKWQLDLQLTIELRLLDVDGAVLWSNVYDSGLRIWEPQKRPFLHAPEKHFEGLARLTHETALALMRTAARDVGEWLRNERLRERAL
jgi:hypothetical protein